MHAKADHAGMTFSDSPTASRHTPSEDIQGLLAGTLLVALSVTLLRESALITGQIAGLSLLLSYAQGWPFGAVFFGLNLPFYWLGYKRMGRVFIAKTFAAVVLLSGFSFLLPQMMSFSTLHPAAGAVLGGVTAGSGLLALFRHGATLGGVGIVAFYLQDTHNIKAGHVQLGFDACVFLVALFLFPLTTVMWSLLGAVVTNIVISVNHRRDRYIAI